jgi:hypothetical protein
MSEPLKLYHAYKPTAIHGLQQVPERLEDLCMSWLFINAGPSVRKAVELPLQVMRPEIVQLILNQAHSMR